MISNNPDVHTTHPTPPKRSALYSLMVISVALSLLAGCGGSKKMAKGFAEGFSEGLYTSRDSLAATVELVSAKAANGAWSTIQPQLDTTLTSLGVTLRAQTDSLLQTARASLNESLEILADSLMSIIGYYMGNVLEPAFNKYLDAFQAYVDGSISTWLTTVSQGISDNLSPAFAGAADEAIKRVMARLAESLSPEGDVGASVSSLVREAIQVVFEEADKGTAAWIWILAGLGVLSILGIVAAMINIFYKRGRSMKIMTQVITEREDEEVLTNALSRADEERVGKYLRTYLAKHRPM